MTLPIKPPYPPMEARLVRTMPRGELQFEPKWDGFRCLIFRDGDEVHLQSKKGMALERYFPEVVAAVRALKHKKLVLDGELVVPDDFEALLQRVHPAATRIAKLARETPALVYVFDLLVDPRGKSLVELPLEQRRARLEKLAFNEGIRLSPATTDRKLAKGWVELLRGHGFDGIMAKALSEPYRSGERSAM